MSAPGALNSLVREEFTSAAGLTREVFRIGSGPAVLVVHEVPGLTPRVAEFGRAVAARGLTAVLPSLLGTPGRAPTNGYGLASMARACLSREFTLLSTGRASPVTDYLRELAAREHATCGGPGVGVVGMCLTGNFALAMSIDPVVVAPVMSQPALPLPLGARRRRSPGVAPADLDRIRQRATEGLCVLGLRFSEDPKVPAERFARLRETLGEGFLAVEIDSSPDNPWGYARGAHSVLTEDYLDTEGSPTRRALDQVLDFLAGRLGVGG
ncbi:MAG: dienelactone hydrolase family protein [Acidimicrobiales bacterium]